MTYDAELSQIADILAATRTIVIIQADNPDADSLGSALALEQILGDMGKEPVLYCGVDIPTYLQYLDGWDRVSRDLPRQFDASIIVDASTMTLLEKLQLSGQRAWVASKPCIVLDHHAEVNANTAISFATATINDATLSSTGELIYTLGKQADWPLSAIAQTFLMTAVLGDTQGLSNQLTSAATYRIMADMTEAGVDRIQLEEKRREAGKMPPEIFRYKGELIKRAEFDASGRVAIVVVPQTEINQFSPLYNPSALIQADMLQTTNVLVSIVLKSYDDGKVTAAIRCNNGAPIAAELASRFGGGGHAYASGFKIDPGKARPVNEIKSECTRVVIELLTTLKQAPSQEITDDKNNEALQHAH